MTKYILHTLEKDDLDDRVSIKIESQNSDFYAIWIEKGVLVLEAHVFNHEIKSLEGTIGKVIQQSSLTEDQKIERCIESIKHKLDFIQHKENQKRIKFK